MKQRVGGLGGRDGRWADGVKRGFSEIASVCPGEHFLACTDLCEATPQPSEGGVWKLSGPCHNFISKTAKLISTVLTRRS